MEYEMKRGAFLPGTLPVLLNERKSWPFKTMNIGDEVVITKDVAKARAAAHTYSAGTDKKFVTRKSGSDLHVYRIA
jgi:hypothetical protein